METVPKRFGRITRQHLDWSYVRVVGTIGHLCARIVVVGFGVGALLAFVAIGNWLARENQRTDADSTGLLPLLEAIEAPPSTASRPHPPTSQAVEFMIQQRAEQRSINLRKAQFTLPTAVQSAVSKRTVLTPGSIVVTASGRYTDIKQFLADLLEVDRVGALEQLTVSAGDASQAVDFRAVLLWGHVSQ